MLGQSLDGVCAAWRLIAAFGGLVAMRAVVSSFVVWKHSSMATSIECSTNIVSSAISGIAAACRSFVHPAGWFLSCSRFVVRPSPLNKKLHFFEVPKPVMPIAAIMSSSSCSPSMRTSSP